jgi:hypothetical protein
MLAVSWTVPLALIGLFIGAGLSFYVGHADWTRVRTGMQARPQYRASLVVVPLLCAAAGALLGTLIEVVF